MKYIPSSTDNTEEFNLKISLVRLIYWRRQERRQPVLHGAARPAYLQDRDGRALPLHPDTASEWIRLVGEAIQRKL